MTRERRNKAIALAVTVLVHAAVAALLLLMAFTTPLPLPGEAGVEVNLGMYNQGMGDNQPQKPTKPVVEQPAPKPQKVDDVIRQDTEETPAIDETKPAEKPQPTVNQKALFKPKNNSEAPKSQGVTGQPGDQGSHEGTTNSDSYTGQGGSGGGPSYSLGGRRAKHLPSPGTNFSEEGKVVVDIWVDREGHVRKTEIGKGTNITNAAMREMARNAAMSAMFTPDSNAAELQKGTITYNFIIRQ